MLPCLVGLILVISVTSSTTALAQGIGPVLYNTIDPQANISIWQINPDGSGDQFVYPAGVGPIWSWDGQRVAISYTPAGDYNANVFVYDLRSGALQQVTAFNELVQTDQSTFVSLAYKAFSPDGQRMAVSAILHTQTTDGSSEDPFLLIYGLDGTPQALVNAGSDATSGRGVGVAWSPVEDVLVYPAAAVTTLQGTGAPFPYVTALYLVAPVADVVQTGQYQQLTVPSAYATLAGWFLGNRFSACHLARWPASRLHTLARRNRQRRLPSICDPVPARRQSGRQRGSSRGAIPTGRVRDPGLLVPRRVPTGF